MGKSYRVTLCQHNNQISSVILLNLFNLAAHFEAETQAELEIKGYKNITLCGASLVKGWRCSGAIFQLNHSFDEFQYYYPDPCWDR